jgi:hypothetical protein
MRSSSQIAEAVLHKLAEEEWNVPQMAALGGGIGLGGGLAGAGFLHKDDIKNLVELHHQRPQLESSRRSLRAMLAKMKETQPAVRDLPTRKLTKLILQNKDQIPPEAYYTARRGYEEGLSGLSKNRELTNLLKKRLMRAGGIGAGLGLGAGVGAGLLAAIGSGKFDK